MRTLSRVAAPLVWLLSVSTESVLKLASRVFRLADRDAKDVMTPRTRVEWLDANEPVDECVRTMAESPHSAFPLCNEDFDQILGIVTVNDVLAAQAAGKLTDLRRLAWQPIFVPETASLLSILEDFKRAGRKIAVVIDEFGGAQGLVTMTDVLEEVVGELNGMQTGEQAMALQRADGSWLLDGMLETEEFFGKLELGEMPEDEDYQTLGGFVMTRLERVPREGETFSWGGYAFEVLDMDGNRVDKVLATPEGEGEAEG
jgi:putative hemolysin